MKKIIYIAILMLLCLFFTPGMNTEAAVSSIEWQKRSGGSGHDWANLINETSDGGYVFIGLTYSNDGDVSGNHGDMDVWIVELNKSGEIMRQKCIGGASEDIVNSFEQTSDGGFILAGSTYSDDGDVSGNHGLGDAWVIKLNASLVVEWQKCFGGREPDVASSIQQTSDGGYIFAGYTYSRDGDASGSHDGQNDWIVKLNESGAIVWQKCLGSNIFDFARFTQETLDGGFIVTGNITIDDRICNIVKLDSSGRIMWYKQLGNTVNSFRRTNDGGYILAGNAATIKEMSASGTISKFGIGNVPPLYTEAWIAKLNASCDIVWEKSFGSSGWDTAHSIEQTSDGGYIVAGDISINGNVYNIIKLNASGEIEWQKSSGSSEYNKIHSIQQTRDGGYIFAGSILTGVDNQDTYAVKLAPSDDGGNDDNGDDDDGNESGSGCNTVTGAVLIVFIALILAIRMRK